MEKYWMTIDLPSINGSEPKRNERHKCTNRTKCTKCVKPVKSETTFRVRFERSFSGYLDIESQTADEAANIVKSWLEETDDYELIEEASSINDSLEVVGEN